MNLTPRAQGRRFRRPAWPEGAFIDVRRVSKGKIKTVNGRNERGEETVLITTDTDLDWVEIPKGKRNK